MSAFTLVTSRRSRQQSRRPLRVNTEHKSPAQLLSQRGSRDFRRQFPTNYDASGHHAGATSAVPHGAWRGTFKLSNTQTFPQRMKYSAKQPKPIERHSTVTPQKRDCAYCHEDDHHIRDCQKAAAATAKKQAQKRQSKHERSTERFSRAQENLRKQVIAAQQAKIMAQQPVVEEENDTSDSEAESVDEIQVVDNSEQIALLTQQIAEAKANLDCARWADAADIEDEIEELEEHLAKLTSSI